MKWKDVKLSRKFTIAFGTVILLLVFVAFWAIFGIQGIVGDAGEVIEGNKLRSELEHKYVQHLHWAQEVNELLTNKEVTELNVQTDPHQCDFGKWYYGEGRKEAEHLAPELRSILDKFEGPHNKLHKSAIKIADVFKQADYGLSAHLREAKADHLIFAHTVKDVVVNNERVNSIEVQKDPHQCNFGKWLYSEETSAMRRENPDFDQICKTIEEPHNRLHEGVVQMEDLYRTGQLSAGKNYYMTVLKPTTYEVLNEIDRMVAWNDVRLEGMDMANEIYHSETMADLKELGNLFDELIETSKDYIMTDDVMLDDANKTSYGVITFSLIATIAAILLALVISKGIIVPVRKGVEFAQKVAQGDLTANVDVYQEDEIGQLAEALRNMVNKLKDIVMNILTGADSITSASQQLSASSQQVSQGASEQASSAEEVSSSMEEMVSNIQQNTENAQQTESIALQATEGIREGNEATAISAKSMKDIAEKISIINEIAFQTNILALNAAVEAARAGEHGKGFAVVAAEVRKLAERSKVAAQEIDEVSKAGVQISEKAGRQLEELVPEIEKTAKLVQEITAASLEQNSGADQINNAIQQLNQVTQQNAAASEEMATSSEELASQADQLKELISYFKTGSENTGQKRKSKGSSLKTRSAHIESGRSKQKEGKISNHSIHEVCEDLKLEQQRGNWDF